MNTSDEAIALLRDAWPMIVEECRACLGGELHYQAMIYHCLRSSGGPRGQIGMNVKQWITNVASEVFRKADLRKHVDYRGGFEPIPDIVLFKPTVGADWRRRNPEHTMREMLVAIEVKASERHLNRLGRAEICRDIEKLAAHKEEIIARGSDMTPVMLVVDTASDEEERMTEWALQESRERASEMGVLWLYLGRDRVEKPSSWG